MSALQYSQVLEAMVRRAWQYFKEKNLKFAFEVLDHAWSYSQGGNYNLENLYTAFYKMYLFVKDYEKAEEFAQKLFEIEKSEIHLSYLAEVYRKSKQYEKALKILAQLPNHNYHRWVRSAYCHMHLHEFEQAMKCFVRARLLSQNSQQIQENLKLRLYTGIVFLYDLALKNNCTDMLVYRSDVIWATQMLRSYPQNNVSDWQMKDYKNALDIARLYNL